MRLCVFDATTGSGPGLIDGDEVIDFRKVDPHLSTNPVDILGAGPAGIDAIQRAAKTAPRLPLASVKLRAPIGRPGKIL